jgi:hypothetical protein
LPPRHREEEDDDDDDCVGIKIAFFGKKKRRENIFKFSFIIMFVTPKRDDDAEEEEEEDRRRLDRDKQRTTTTMMMPPMREEKTSPEEHESAAILFQLMTCTNTTKTAAQKKARKVRQDRLNRDDPNVKCDENDCIVDDCIVANTTKKTEQKKKKNDEKGEMDGSSVETPPVVGTKRRLSSKFNRAMMMVVEEKTKPLPRPVLAGWYSNAKKKHKACLQQQKTGFANLNDFIHKRLFKAGENVVPKSWVAFARATSRGEDAAVREAATCSDYAQDECKKIIKSKTKTRSKKNNENNNDGDDDDDDGDDDENNENDAENEIDGACRRARYVKGVTKLSTDLIRRNPSAAWLECLAADAHDRARQIRKTKKICEKMRKHSIAWMYKMNKIAPTRATSQEAAVEDVSTIALANVCANWELGLAREMEIYIDQLENVELISDKAMAINGEKTDVDVRAFSMEQFERSNEREHQKAKHLVTKLRTHSEKVAALWRHDAKGRNDF